MWDAIMFQDSLAHSLLSEEEEEEEVVWVQEEPGAKV